MSDPPTIPPPDCDRCPRLVELRRTLRTEHPTWHNRPVPSFGGLDATLLVVGLAPGRNGANRTGRPFTGDAAGEVLYPALARHGFGSGAYGARPEDGFVLRDCRITNAVRCLPPQNRPSGQETAACREFLAAEIRSMPRLRAVLALGRVAHGSAVAALAFRVSAVPFAHGAVHRIDGLVLADSYHCSRYNLNTGRLTNDMFDSVLAAVRVEVDSASRDAAGDPSAGV